MSAWATVGAATTAASISPARSSRRSKTRTPSSPAFGSGSWTPTSSTPGREERMRTWFRPMAPVPTTATRRLLSVASCPPATGLGLVDSALGGLDEVHQVVDRRIARQLAFDLLQRLGRVQAGAHQKAQGLIQAADAVGLETLALEADRVEAVEGRLQAHGLRERQRVHGDDAVAPDVGVAPHPAELVHRGEGRDRGVVVDLHVSGERGIVGEDRTVPYLAVVGHVGVGHEEVVAADAGDPASLGRA